MKPLLNLFYKKHAKLYYDFKDRSPSMAAKDFADFYELTAHVPPIRETDLARASIDAIVGAVQPGPVLEVGAGKCYLANLMSTDHAVTAADIFFDEATQRSHPTLTFVRTPIEKLPFADGAFETVVCANTLEHIPHFQIAVQELRRVAKRRLIIVMPRQRPFRYTFDAHVHFFPYRFSVLLAINPPSDRTVHCEIVGGDWFYIEDVPVA